MKMLLVLLAAVTVLAPSGILSHPAKYNRQSVTVLGTARGVVAVRLPGQSVFTRMLLCDVQCMTVFAAGAPSVANGQNTQVTGTFYVFYEHGAIGGRNIIVGNGL